MHPLRPEDPTRLGPYRLTHRLGAGGMGEVFLGQSASGRRFAVKVIRPELSAEPQFRERFQREIAALRSVSGFYTAPVAEADADGDPAWLATVFVDGPSLAEAVAADGPLPVDRLRSLTAGLAEALAAVHKAGVTHRDLKPSNVLLSAEGPRIIDFGIAVAAGAGPLTRTGVLIGTPSYMSPEQITRRPVGPESDVFSLGSTLAHAATGRAPFGSGSLAEQVFRITTSEPDLDGMPDELRPLVAACLTKDPARRPTPGQIVAALTGDRDVSMPELASAHAALPESHGRRRGFYVLAGAMVITAAVAGLVAVWPSGSPGPLPDLGGAIAHSSAPSRTPTTPAVTTSVPTATPSTPVVTTKFAKLFTADDAAAILKTAPDTLTASPVVVLPEQYATKNVEGWQGSGGKAGAQPTTVSITVREYTAADGKSAAQQAAAGYQIDVADSEVSVGPPGPVRKTQLAAIHLAGTDAASYEPSLDISRNPQGPGPSSWDTGTIEFLKGNLTFSVRILAYDTAAGVRTDAEDAAKVILARLP